MEGDDRVRHCHGCGQDVFNVSAMTREEADALLRYADGSLCVRFYRRADGTVMTSDCWVGRDRLVARILVTVLLVGAFVSLPWVLRLLLVPLAAPRMGMISR